MPHGTRRSQAGRSPLGVVLPFLVSSAFVLVLGAARQPRSVARAEAPIEELCLTILHTNDEHASLIPHSPAIDHDPLNPEDPTVGGFTRLATAIAAIRSEKDQVGEPVLLLGAGDFLGGTPFSWLAPAQVAPELALMQSLGYDAVTIGNHEYDYGPDVLADYLQAAGYPAAHERTVVLASNTLPNSGHPMAQDGLLRQSAIVELSNGLRVGLFGLLGTEAQSLAADTGEFAFLDRQETARQRVADLRRERVDLVIAITHAGLAEDRALAQAVPGIHVIVGGHSHTVLQEPVIEGSTIIVQAGADTAYLGRLELAYSAMGELRIRNSELGHSYLIPIDASIPPDREISLLVEGYRHRLDGLLAEMTGGRYDNVMAPLASADFDLPYRPPFQETPAADLIADAMRLVSQEAIGTRVDVAVQANGSIRAPILRGRLPHAAGQISFYDLASTIGLGYGQDGYAGYPIVSVYLTGEELRRLLEVSVLLQELLGDDFFLQYSGLRYEYDPENAVLLTVPFLDLPLPTGRSVTRADLYVGNGLQPAGDDPGYVSLEWGDEKLYHLVTDRYILSFLPMVGEMLPDLLIEPKDATGNVVSPEEFDRLIVHGPDGRELKVWQTVVDYVSMQPLGAKGLPHIPPYYAQISGRIEVVRSFPLIALVYGLFLVPIAALAVLLVRRKGRRRRAGGAAAEDAP